MFCSIIYLYKYTDSGLKVCKLLNIVTVLTTKFQICRNENKNTVLLK